MCASLTYLFLFSELLLLLIYAPARDSKAEVAQIIIQCGTRELKRVLWTCADIRAIMAWCIWMLGMLQAFKKMQHSRLFGSNAGTLGVTAPQTFSWKRPKVSSLLVDQKAALLQNFCAKISWQWVYLTITCWIQVY